MCMLATRQYLKSRLSTLEIFQHYRTLCLTLNWQNHPVTDKRISVQKVQNVHFSFTKQSKKHPLFHSKALLGLITWKMITSQFIIEQQQQQSTSKPINSTWVPMEDTIEPRTLCTVCNTTLSQSKVKTSVVPLLPVSNKQCHHDQECCLRREPNSRTNVLYYTNIAELFHMQYLCFFFK